MLITWFLLAGFIFLLAPQDLTSKFQFAFAHTFRVPLSFGRAFTLSSRVADDVDVVPRRQYEQLQNHLENVYKELREERNRFEKLYGLYNRHVWEGAEFVLADIINSRSMGENLSELVINRGEIDGICPGLYVLGDNSVIGKISKVSDQTATVRLITSPESKLPVIIGNSLEDVIRGTKHKTAIKTVIQGVGNNTAKVPYLSIKKRVREGDMVYAGKEAGFLDAPMVLGQVRKCSRNDLDPSLWDIVIKPVCDFELLENVAVIIMQKDQ